MADLSVKLPKPKFGQVVVLQKNGDEPRGHGFPLIGNTCVIGRCETADIRVSSADVSLIHCKISIDENSGEASLEILGNETQINDTLIDPVTTVKLDHNDVILVGGRRLRFEYLPPDYKPIPNKPQNEELSDSFKAEVVDKEENGDIIEYNSDKEDEETVPMPFTPSTKRVSFGPYLSPEQFDNKLPPATPVKRGATPRRSMRYSGLKFTRSTVDPVMEEDLVSETITQDESIKEDVISDKSDRVLVEDSMVSEEQDATSVESVDETGNDSPSLPVSVEYPGLPTSTSVDNSSVDAMSTMSDVSNMAIVPSECCSFLDEPIEEDFGPEVVEQEDLSQMEDPIMYDANEDLMSTESVETISAAQTNGSCSIAKLSTSISRLEETVDDDEEEGITLSPEDMCEKKNSHSVMETTETGKMEEKESKIPSQSPMSPQADNSDVQGVKPLTQTPKPSPASPESDYSKVEGVTDMPETPKPSLKVVEQDHTNVGGVQKVSKTPKVAISIEEEVVTLETPPTNEYAPTNGTDSPNHSHESPEKSPEVVQQSNGSKKTNAKVSSSPKADYSDVLGVKQLMRTPKPPPSTPKADYSDVAGIKRLVQTPKPCLETPKADYSNVVGVKELLKTPKTKVMAAAVSSTPEADYSDVRGVKQLLQTPKPPPNTPKADYTNVGGLKRLMRTPKVLASPKADYSDVEGIDRLMNTPKPEKKEQVPAVIVEKLPQITDPVTTPSISPDSGCQTPPREDQDVILEPVDEMMEIITEPIIEETIVGEDEPTTIVEENKEEIVTDLVEESIKPTEEVVEEEAIKSVDTPRRGRRAAPTPKTNTPKVVSKRGKSEEDEIMFESVPQVATVTEEPTDFGSTELEQPKEADELVENAVQTPNEVEKVGQTLDNVDEEIKETSDSPKEPVEQVASTPRRGRRAAPTPKTNTPKVVSKRGKPEAESEEDGIMFESVRQVATVTEEPTDFGTTELEQPKEADELVENAVQTPNEDEKVGQTLDKVDEEIKETSNSPKEPVEQVASTPRRGRRAVPTPKTNTPKPRSKRNQPVIEPEEEEKEEVFANIPQVSTVREEPDEVEIPVPDQPKETDELTHLPEKAEVDIKETAKTLEEPIEEAVNTPRRGRRGTATSRTNLPRIPVKRKPSDAESVPDETESVEMQHDEVTTMSEENQPVVVEEAKEETAPVEEAKEETVPKEVESTDEAVDVKTPATPRRLRRAVAPKARSEPAKPRAKRVKRASDSESHTGESEVVELEKKDEKIVEEETHPVVERDSVPASENESVPVSVSESVPAVVEDSVEKVEEPMVEEVVKVPGTPRRGRRAAATPKVETPKTRPKRSKRQSDSDAGQDESEPADRESRPLRSKRRKDDVQEELPSAVPVVRLTRCQVPEESSLKEPQTSPKARKKRGGSTSSTKEDVEEKATEEVPASPKATRKRAGSSASAKEEVEEKPAPVRRGRGRAAKAVDSEESSSTEALEDKMEKEEAPRRTTAPRRAKTAAATIVDSSDDTNTVDSDSLRKTTTRRAAAKRNVPVAEKLETVPEEKKPQSKRTGANKPGLDDVEMLHEGKGHASDIHANHMPDDVITEEKEEEEEEGMTKEVRSTRSKKTLKVHFGVVGEEQVPASPVRATRGRKAAVPISPDRRVSVRLERDPEIETLAAATTTNDDEEDVTKVVKRLRGKRVAASAPAPESPPKTSATTTTTKRSRGKRAAETEATTTLSSSPPPPAPSPRRTRRTRN